MHLLYAVLRSIVRLLLHTFYGRIEVVGLDRVPRTGPLVVAANHPNGLIDSMLLIATLPRRLAVVTKAPLFHHPVLGPVLRAIGAIPVHRREDHGADPTRNDAAMTQATATLRHERAILIFPEGTSHADPTVRPLRTGTARIVLGVEAAARPRLGVAVLPVGLVYHRPGTFRVGRATVMIGRPVPIEDTVAEYRQVPEPAVRRLTERVGEALRAQVVEAGDGHTLELLGVASALWHADDPRAVDAGARVAWMQRAMRAYAYLARHAPATVVGVREAVERYRAGLARARLTAPPVTGPERARAAARFILRESAVLLLALPVALGGFLLHLLPHELTAWLVRRQRPEPDMEATLKLSAAAVCYPGAWLLEAALAGWAGGRFVAMLVTASLLPAGLAILLWRERVMRVAGEVRVLVGVELGHPHLQQLVREGARLRECLIGLASHVPEAVLAGQVSS